MPLSVGDKLGPYEILGLVGKGGMGEVYKARDTRLHRDVAVKVLPQAFATQAALERFQREARAASALNHPNICAVHDVGEDPGYPFLVMELLDGKRFTNTSAGSRWAFLPRWRSASKWPTLLLSIHWLIKDNLGEGPFFCGHILAPFQT